MAAVDLEPQRFLQLAGHPLRWHLLVELAGSDRTVSELTDRSEHPQNLVSYHLGKLRRAGLVAARKSSADGRDSYYTLDLARVGAMLSAAGGSLNPGLAMSPSPAVDGSLDARTSRVLFLCTGNSARSQIAAALTAARSAGVVEASSAGSHPKPVHPNAVRVLRDDYGIELRSPRSTHVGEFADERFDRVVTLCDRVREVCPEFRGAPRTIHWSVADPAAGFGPGDDEASYPAFREVAAELDTRITYLLATLASDDRPPRETP